VRLLCRTRISCNVAIMKILQLTQDKVALVDDEDYDRCNEYNWCYNRECGYAQGNVGRTYPVRLHIFILNFPESDIDHKNRDKLDCQKHNLRLCNDAQNQQNKIKSTRNGVATSSKYKGVSWKMRKNKWTAQIRVDGLGIHLGYFTVETEAARAYDVAALQHFGEFALLNFPLR
jgi:AP2 domain